MVCRLTQNTQGLAIVTGCAIARDPDMLVALDQKVGGADMTGIAGCGCMNMIDGFWFGPDSSTCSVATSAVFGGVLENPLHVTLFTLQGEVNIP
jgi:hypothetical protein